MILVYSMLLQHKSHRNQSHAAGFHAMAVVQGGIRWQPPAQRAG